MLNDRRQIAMDEDFAAIGAAGSGASRHGAPSGELCVCTTFSTGGGKPDDSGRASYDFTIRIGYEVMVELGWKGGEQVVVMEGNMGNALIRKVGANQTAAGRLYTVSVAKGGQSGSRRVVGYPGYVKVRCSRLQRYTVEPQQPFVAVKHMAFDNDLKIKMPAWAKLKESK